MLNRLVAVSVGIWLVAIPFKNALFELSSAWVIALASMLLVADHLLARQQRLPGLPTGLLLSFGAVVASMLAANLLGRQTSEGYWIAAHFLVRYGGMFACLYYLYFQGYLGARAIYLGIFLSLLLQSLFGLLQFATHFDFLRDRALIHGARIYGGTFNPNPFGLLMAVGAALCSWSLSHWRAQGRPRNLAFAGLLLLFAFNLLLSGSRSSWLMYIVFLSVLGLTNSHIRLKHFVALSGLLLALCALLYWLVPQSAPLLERAFLLDTSARVTIWRATLAHIASQPWLGHGAGQFSELAQVQFTSVHNSVLEILLYTGLVGLLCFGALAAGLLRLAIQSRSQCLLALGCGFFVASLFDHSVFDSKIYLSSCVVLVFMMAVAWVQQQSPGALASAGGGR